MHVDTDCAQDTSPPNGTLPKRPSTNELPRKLLEKDYADCQETLRGSPQMSFALENGNLFHWKLEVCGGRGSLWTGLKIDLEILFSRRHPFEPPRIYLSKSSRNFRNPKHHLADGGGRICLDSLSCDHWSPCTSCNTLLGWISDLFSASCTPPSSNDHPQDAFAHFSRELCRHTASFLTPQEVGNLGSTSKNMLALTHSEALWSFFYYKSPSLAPFALLRLARHLGPQRVLGENGIFYWQGAREAYIRAKQMNAVLTRGVYAVECPSIKAFVRKELALTVVLLRRFVEDSASSTRIAWFTQMIGALRERKAVLVRVLGRDINYEEVEYLNITGEKLFKTFLASGLTPDQILDLIRRLGLLQLTFHQQHDPHHYPLNQHPFQQQMQQALEQHQQQHQQQQQQQQHGLDLNFEEEGDDDEDVGEIDHVSVGQGHEGPLPLIEDCLNVMNGLTALIYRSFRCNGAMQRLDVYDREGQWLSATVLPNTDLMVASVILRDQRLILREVMATGLTLQSLFRMQAMGGGSSSVSDHLVMDNLETDPHALYQEFRADAAGAATAAGGAGGGVGAEQQPQQQVPAADVVGDVEEEDDDQDLQVDIVDVPHLPLQQQQQQQAQAQQPLPPSNNVNGHPSLPQSQAQQQQVHYFVQQLQQHQQALAAPIGAGNHNNLPPLLAPQPANLPPHPHGALAGAGGGEDPLARLLRREEANALHVHFDDHAACFDERVSFGQRVSPFRTRTTRPRTLAMDTISAIVHRLNHDEICQAPADYLSIQVRSFWAQPTEGGGQVRYIVPPHMTAEKLRDDFCGFLGMEAAGCRLIKIKGKLAADYRKSIFKTRQIVLSQTLKENGIGNHDLIELVGSYALPGR